MATYDPNKLIEGVYRGVISIYSLPDELYEFTRDKLLDEVERGFKPHVFIDLKSKIWDSFKKNIKETSGAKTFDEILTLQTGVFDEAGKKRPFKQFREIALQIDAEYNVNWLKTEQTTAFAQSISADKWIRTLDQKERYPLIKYLTVGDARVRPEHAAWDGIIKPVEDEFWDTRLPPNDWRCRCRWISLRKGDETDLGKHLRKFNAEQRKNGRPTVESLENDSKIFNTNPVKNGQIFKKSEIDYFKQPREFNDLKKGNYGFGYD